MTEQKEGNSKKEIKNLNLQMSLPVQEGPRLSEPYDRDEKANNDLFPILPRAAETKCHEWSLGNHISVSTIDSGVDRVAILLASTGISAYYCRCPISKAGCP